MEELQLYNRQFNTIFVHFEQYQGDERLDTDLPTLLEAKLFNSTFGKFCWILLQPFFYSFRPLIVYPKPPVMLEYVNLVIQLTFDAIVWYFLGKLSIKLLNVQFYVLLSILYDIYENFFIVSGGKVLAYFLFGSVMAMGLHPVAGHFISEHYMYKKGYETYSYYGPLNFITFNVGYHNEHHDFPAVPGSRLPEVHMILFLFIIIALIENYYYNNV